MGAPTEIGPNDTTPQGVTAAALLAAVSGTHLATLTWGTPPADTLVTIHPTGTTRLTIDVTPTTGSVAFYQPMSAEGGCVVGRSVCGPGFFAIEAGVHFVTDDGGFDETWQVMLTADPGGQSARFTQTLLPSALTGTFSVTDRSGQHWTSTETLLTATFDDRGPRGTADYATEKVFTTGPSAGAGEGFVLPAASWVPLAGGYLGSDGGSDAGMEGGIDTSADAATE